MPSHYIAFEGMAFLNDDDEMWLFTSEVTTWDCAGLAAKLMGLAKALPYLTFQLFEGMEKEWTHARLEQMDTFLALIPKVHEHLADMILARGR